MWGPYAAKHPAVTGLLGRTCGLVYKPPKVDGSKNGVYKIAHKLKLTTRTRPLRPAFDESENHASSGTLPISVTALSFSSPVSGIAVTGTVSGTSGSWI